MLIYIHLISVIFRVNYFDTFDVFSSYRKRYFLWFLLNCVLNTSDLIFRCFGVYTRSTNLANQLQQIHESTRRLIREKLFRICPTQNQGITDHCQRDHLLSTYAKFSEKVTFLVP